MRGRTVVEEDAERYGKYRPVSVNGTMYNHPLGLNLYNLNNSKDNIGKIKKAIVFEGELFALVYFSQFATGGRREGKNSQEFLVKRWLTGKPKNFINSW